MRSLKPYTLAFLATILSSGSAAADPGRAPACGEEVPTALSVPRGNELSFAWEAEGVQVYACAANGASFAWTLERPEARLSEAGGRAAGTHYAGPTWESTDGSKVVGAKVEAATPDAAAIPWLLLRAASHAGSGRMEAVTFVQRVRTAGGNAPATGCDAGHAGATVRVPYRALYCFYRSGAAYQGAAYP
jgi:uncharacterized protein DUF3455